MKWGWVDMRIVAFIFWMLAASSAQAQGAPADCWVIARLDTLYAVQSRLRRNVDELMFKTDILTIQSELDALTGHNILAAIGTNLLTQKGQQFQRFFHGARDLLDQVDLDDPASVQAYFTPAVRTNLDVIGQHLAGLRCFATAVLAVEDKTAQTTLTDEHDVDDNAAEILHTAAKEILKFTNLIIFAVLLVGSILGTRGITAVLRRNKRRARRRPTAYNTNYIHNDQHAAGVVVDINCFGVKLKHGEDDRLPPGATIDVLVLDEWAQGSVAWVNNHYAGIKFTKRIRLKTVRLVCELPPTTKEKDGAQRNAA